MHSAMWAAWLAITLGSLTRLAAQTLPPSEAEAALLSPQVAAGSMQVPAGVQVTLFAAEPAVMQPIGFCIDDRRRLWVAEALNYPDKGSDRDRILILTDEDGDGRHDQRRVFYEGLNYVTGIEVGFGGAWVMSPPNFYFIPDGDGDDVPDGPPQIVLDGFGIHANAHNIANGLAWGPDGWLYGTHGRTNWSLVGRPGAGPDERVRFDGGVYRYHPVRQIWEPYADGTTNPWGIDWNDYGAAFVCNCVNPHLFQVIQGAHYEPWRGRESSQFAYQRIDTIADHLHFVGLRDVRSGLGSAAEDAAGGGHAHCGTMIYLGDNFPDAYRNTLFTNNIHGRRINNDRLERHGSGYIASHAPDLMKSRDPWFMGVTLAYGPAGEIYVSDWSDTGECHSIRNTQKETGRIYRLTHGAVVAPAVDLQKLSSLELVELQWHANDWYVRHARRVLQERHAQGASMTDVHARLRGKFASLGGDVPRLLRALWCLYVTGGATTEWLTGCLEHPSQDVRSWSVTLLCDAAPPAEPVRQRLVQLARSEPAAVVRLSLACGLQRLPLAERWELAEALLSRGEDAHDANLPLMLWYGCEPLVAVDLPRFERLIAMSDLDRVRTNGARRIMDSPARSQGLELIMQRLAQAPVAADALSLLEGILQGVEGERQVAMPDSWPAAYSRLMQRQEPQLRDRAVRLAVKFDDKQALAQLQLLAQDEKAAVVDRQRALEALTAKRPAGWDRVLLGLLNDSALRGPALRALATFDDPQIAAAVVALYPQLDASDRQTALMTLATRAAWADVLLHALESQSIAASDLTAYPVRLMRALGNADIDRRLTKLWGTLRETPQQRTEQVAKVKAWLAPALASGANLQRGSELFAKHCGTCHRLFGTGGEIGPDLTGAQRHNLDYMLETILDPSAAVSKDYQMEILRTVDGRVLTGLVEATGQRTLSVQTINERVVLPVEEIEERKLTEVSMMPSGLLELLRDDEIRDLFAFLQQTQQ